MLLGVDDDNELFSIGQMAKRTGLSVRTIRFWSDRGVITPTRRSTGGYRLYDAHAVARLELVRTLRELGLSLDTVKAIVTGQRGLTDVVHAHLDALDTQIRGLRLQRAVLRSVVQRRSTTEELRIMNELAKLSARQRQEMINGFVDRVFDGVDPQAPGAHIATAMRQLPDQLPDDPTPEQVDAWLELASLVADPQFEQRARQMAVAGGQQARAGATPPVDPTVVQQHAGAAVAAGVTPDSADGRRVLDQIVEPALPAADRLRMADGLETFTDRRVERYWQLLGVLNGWPALPSAVPAFEWVIAALRASAVA